MTRGRGARWALRRIEAYRRSRVAHDHPGACRFEPTCSRYAEEAFLHRRFAMAVALTLWRILRCNSMATPGPDPLQHRRFRPRRNAVASAVVGVSFCGAALILAGEVAHAQSLSGGCTATVNGRAPASLTKDNPLVVHKGEQVSLQGVVPAAVASLPPEQITSQTNITISFVESLLDTTKRQEPGTGPNWGGSVNVDDYLRYGAGLYKVEGTSSGNPGWTCTGDGYVKLEGSPLSKPVGQVAMAMFAVAGAGAVASTRTKTPDPSITGKSLGQDLSNDVDILTGHAKPVPDKAANRMSNAACFMLALIALADVFIQRPRPPEPAAPGSILLLNATGAAPRPDRVWVRGHVVLGFVSGLLGGLAVSVLAQQFAFWTFTVLNLIVFPLLVGVLAAARAWRGKAFLVGGPAANAGPDPI